MPRFRVTVSFEQKRTKELTVWADDEVLGWDDVTDAEAVEVEDA